MFVLLLLLLIRRVRPLIGAITAFTLAHSTSLAAATFGWIVVPVAPVKAVIALSIAVLAAELAHPPDRRGLRLIERFPWAVSFSFGLLHGLGFASALIEIGLPQRDVPLALFAFNLGVEAGQLLFIGAVLATGVLIARLMSRQHRIRVASSHGLVTASYFIGSLASFWMVERIAGFAA